MKIPKKVDYLVVGGGLIGLNTLKKLRLQGHDAILIEKSGALGGSLLNKTSDTEFSLESLIWSQEQNTALFSYDQTYGETLSLGKKGLMPFMGFGEEKVPALETVELFASMDSHIITDVITNDFPIEKTALHTQITRMEKINGHETYSLFELNGKTALEAHHVIWTAPLQELDAILPKEDFGPFRQKMKKAKHFDAITAKFEVSKEEIGAYKNNKFIFMGEEETPWLGCFLTEDQMTFISYYDSFLSSDHDFIRKHLKTLKRRLHKAFPDTFDEESAKNFSNEKISLHKSALSTFNPAQKDWQLKELPNFSLLSSLKSFWPHPLDEKLKFLDSDLLKAPTPDSELGV